MPIKRCNKVSNCTYRLLFGILYRHYPRVAETGPEWISMSHATQKRKQLFKPPLHNTDIFKDFLAQQETYKSLAL